jgi:hypothetical protein
MEKTDSGPYISICYSSVGDDSRLDGQISKAAAPYAINRSSGAQHILTTVSSTRLLKQI